MRYTRAQVDNPVVASGDQAWLKFDIDTAKWMNDIETILGMHRNDGEFFIDVVYGDILGLDRTRARFSAFLDKKGSSWGLYKIGSSLDRVDLG
jgi:hypothetical protein